MLLSRLTWAARTPRLCKSRIENTATVNYIVVSLTETSRLTTILSIMQQFIACSENAFAFGDPDQIVLRNYEYLLPEDCLPLSQVRANIADPRYGYRYKLLWDAINHFAPNASGRKKSNRHRHGPCDTGDIRVALVVIANGPLFVDVRHITRSLRDRVGELMPAAAGLHLQFYIPSNEAGEDSTLILISHKD